MAHPNPATLSYTELRDCLEARAKQLNAGDDIDLAEVLRYFTELPASAHTPTSVEGLIWLARNFFFAARPDESIRASSLASRLATEMDQKLLLCEARGLEGLALTDLGRFTEATLAHGEAWQLARMLGEIELEISTVKRVGGLWSAMAQFDVAITYYTRAREMAAQHGVSHLELESRNNIANSAVQLRDPVLGLRALLPFQPPTPKTRMEVLSHANAHDTLAHLYLLTGDLPEARAHAQESGRLAELAAVGRTTQRHEALLGLIDVHAGAVERGLAALETALAFAKRVDYIDAPDFLGMCVDAYEAAGQSDKALAYLNELVDWKKQSIDAQVMPLQYEGVGESLRFQTGVPAFENALVARSQRLHNGVQQRVQHLVETAINADVASGHDLYRIFRVAKLSSCLAQAIGWPEDRIPPLMWGAQLCNIGMIAMPARILQKRRGLSDSERDVIQTHTQYGAELLRKSKLQIVEVAARIAEHHHERYDGGGYPSGLAGAEISEEARIVSICDAFDAMTHRRPWRVHPLSVQTAMNEIRRGAGSQFDPQLVSAFTAFVQREFWEHDDFDAFLSEGADELEYVRARTRMEALMKPEGSGDTYA